MSHARFTSDGLDMAPSLVPLLDFLEAVPLPTTIEEAVGPLVHATPVFSDSPAPTAAQLDSMVSFAKSQVAGCPIPTWDTPYHEVLKQAIYLYTMETPCKLYLFCNAALNAKDKRNTTFLAPYSPYFKLLMTACMSLPPAMRYVGRAVRVVLVRPDRPDPVEWFNDYKTHYAHGKTICFGAFTSMTVDDDVVETFSASGKEVIVLKFISAVGYNIAPLSAYGDAEKEVLVLPPSSFVVTSRAKAVSTVIVDLEPAHGANFGRYMTPPSQAYPGQFMKPPNIDFPWSVALQRLHIRLRSTMANYDTIPDNSHVERMLREIAQLLSPTQQTDLARNVESLTTSIASYTASTHPDAHQRLQIFATVETAAVLCSAVHHATTADAVKWSFSAICNAVAHNGNASDTNTRRNIFATREMAIAVCSAVPHATTADAVGSLFGAVCGVTYDSGNAIDTNTRQNIFATRDIERAVCSAVHHATTAAAVRWVFGAVWSVTYDNGNAIDTNTRRNIFATRGIERAVRSAVLHATTADAVRWLFVAVCNLTADSGNAIDTNTRRNIFATRDMQEAVCKAVLHATTADAVGAVFTAVDQLTDDSGCKISARCRAALFQRDDFFAALRIAERSAAIPVLHRVAMRMFSGSTFA